MGTRLFSIILVTWFCVCPALAGELTGRSIIKEQQRRHQSDNEFSSVDLTLTDRRGEEKQQKLMLYLSKTDGKTKSLIQYLEPVKIRGVGLLTWEQDKDKEDDQWLYLPAARSIKRIAGGSKKNQFMGTDMAYEDMRPENMEVHSYTLLGSETVDGKNCWIIDSVPTTEKEKNESGYGKRVMWVDQSSYFTLKVDYFDHHKRLIKTVLFEDIRPLSGQLFRSFKITWNRISQKTRTVMVYEKIDINMRHNDSIFTHTYMKRPVR